MKKINFTLEQSPGHRPPCVACDQTRNCHGDEAEKQYKIRRKDLEKIFPQTRSSQVSKKQRSDFGLHEYARRRQKMTQIERKIGREADGKKGGS